LYLDETDNTSGIFTIENTIFKNNTSEFGTAINAKYFNQVTGSKIEIRNSEFINNTANKYGGAIQSIGEYNDLHFFIINCKFINNQASLGNDIYTLTKKSLPRISNINMLELDKESIVTNPTRIKLVDDSFQKISIYSGESIPNNIYSKF